MFKYMRGNYEIERLIFEWQIFYKTEHSGPVCYQWRPMALAGCLIRIQQHVGTWIRIAARPHFQYKGLLANRGMKASQRPRHRRKTDAAKK